MKAFECKLVSSLEKIFPTKEPTGEGVSREITCLKGETTSFQIGYFWNYDRKLYGKVKIEAPEGVNVRVRTVGLVPCAYPYHLQADDDYLTTEPGLYPDLLSDMTEFGFPLVVGQWRSLWVDVETDENTDPGLHPIELTLTVDTTEEQEFFDFTVDVLNANLPELSIPHTEWFHCDCLANYYDVDVFSEEHWQIIENFIQTAVKRGCNMILTPIFTPPLDTAVGGERRTVQLIDVTVTSDGYEFGYEKLERWIAMCQRCGVKYFEISHLFSQWGAVATPKIVGMVDGKEEKIFGWQTKATGEEYSAFMRQFLVSFTEKLKSMGIEKQCYFHISDEPSLEQKESYRAAKEMVSEYLKDFHMIDALSDFNFYKEGILDEPICATNHIEPFLKERPEKLWAYYCIGQYLDVSNRFIVQPGYRTRILGVQLYKYDIDGFLHWGYNFYNSQYSLYPINPYQCTDAGEAFASGDPFVVYPGKDGKPEESMRLMYMNEAMQDLMVMKYLEQLTDKSTVMNCIEWDGMEELTFSKYPRNLTYLQHVKEKVYKEIKRNI